MSSKEMTYRKKEMAEPQGWGGGNEGSSILIQCAETSSRERNLLAGLTLPENLEGEGG